MRFLPLRPKLMARIAANYYKMLALRKPCLRVVNIALSYQCQLACRHCSAQTLRFTQDKNDGLTLPQIKTLLYQAQKCGAINVHFTGGEPLLYPHFYKVVSLVDASRNILSLATNGMLLVGESGNLKKARFDLVIVSIDSPDAAIHDHIRGYKGAYQKAWEGIEAARRQGLRTMLAMIVTRRNLHNGEVSRQINICRKEKIPLQLLPVRRPAGCGNDAQPLLSPEDLEGFYQMASSGDVRWDGYSSYLSARCLAGRERLYIDPAGNVYPCDFIHKAAGNIKNEPLKAIWERMLNIAPYDHANAHCLSALTG